MLLLPYKPRHVGSELAIGCTACKPAAHALQRTGLRGSRTVLGRPRTHGLTMTELKLSVSRETYPQALTLEGSAGPPDLFLG